MAKGEWTASKQGGAQYTSEDVEYYFSPYITIGSRYKATAARITVTDYGHGSASFTSELCARINYSSGSDDLIYFTCNVTSGTYTSYSAITYSLSDTVAKNLCSKTITGATVYRTSGRDVRVLSTSQFTLEIWYDSAVSLTEPGKPTITQNGDYFNISWSPAIGTGGTGPVTYQVMETHEGEYLLDQPTTATSVNIPVMYPVEVAQEGEGIRVLIIAYYEDLETSSESTNWDPQHVLYCYTGTKWQQSELYYYDGTSFIPCKIHYYNNSGGWLG